MDAYDRALGTALTALALIGLAAPAIAMRDQLDQVTGVMAPDTPGPEPAALDDALPY
ncbi:hypothetical protein [Streptomyces jumonjinensis]|uniref:hypothetical protein n=1 Tax=Streptomyces jumonjinensis TaxID=1945 RepID=UPI00129745DE|nr:hypothetical protein [Streptomyces jumonjinensis]